MTFQHNTGTLPKSRATDTQHNDDVTDSTAGNTGTPCSGLISRYNNDSLLNLSLLVQERLSLSAVQPVQVLVIISTGTCRNLEKLLNSWFMLLQTVSLGFQVVSVGVDLVVH